jgi:hypothetical protein
MVISKWQPGADYLFSDGVTRTCLCDASDVVPRLDSGMVYPVVLLERPWKLVQATHLQGRIRGVGGVHVVAGPLVEEPCDAVA